MYSSTGLAAPTGPGTDLADQARARGKGVIQNYKITFVRGGRGGGGGITNRFLARREGRDLKLLIDPLSPLP